VTELIFSIRDQNWGKKTPHKIPQKISMLRSFLIQPLLFALLVFSGCKPADDISSLPAIDKNKKEIVFVTHNGPTTYYLNSDNQPAGIEYDLAAMFVKQYYPEYTLRFVLVDSISDVIPSLLKNKAHIAAANLTKTHLREHLVLFSSLTRKRSNSLSLITN
jgi:membrane-bound lytic murein transglycosylase F